MPGVYFDASLIVSLIVRDSLSPRAWDYISRHEPLPIVSDFASAEVASAVNLKVRVRELDVAQGRSALAEFDLWRADMCETVDISTADVSSAEALLRRLDLPLRAADAIHIAAARRMGALLATFDTQMAATAGMLAVALAPL
jgi:hypothetical protein